MIVNVRGTHGSGKSTLVREVMSLYPDRQEVRKAIRRRPLGYILWRPERYEDFPAVFVPGHYETPCGGCDTITVVNDAYHVIGEHASLGYDVLFEGILAQHSGPQLRKLNERFPGKLRVVVIDISDEEAIAAVQSRRAEAGKEPLENTDNIVKENRGARKSVEKMQELGIPVWLLSRADALGKVKELLGW
jgi:energy-coupling factor transporter ATP-binding protein EcfA2